jgi:hypothetical protein
MRSGLARTRRPGTPEVEEEPLREPGAVARP